MLLVFFPGAIAGYFLSAPLLAWFFSAIKGQVISDVLIEPFMLQGRFAVGSGVFFSSLPLAMRLADSPLRPMYRLAVLGAAGLGAIAITAIICHHQLVIFVEGGRLSAWRGVKVSEIPTYIIPLSGAVAVLVIALASRRRHARLPSSTPP